MKMEIGTIVRGFDIGKPYHNKYIWSACEKCGKERWTCFYVRENKPKYSICESCSQKNLGQRVRGQLRESMRGAGNPMWKGGRFRSSQGYIYIWVSPDDFFYPMANPAGYVFEHRLVMAKHIGRCLHSWEIVHHKNHIRDDNRTENLQLVSDDRHKQLSILENKIRQLGKRLIALQIENNKLKRLIARTTSL